MEREVRGARREGCDAGEAREVEARVERWDENEVR
jgi:hypothetical protein